MKKRQKGKSVPFFKYRYNVTGGSFNKLYKMLKAEKLHADGIFEQKD